VPVPRARRVAEPSGHESHDTDLLPGRQQFIMMNCIIDANGEIDHE